MKDILSSFVVFEGLDGSGKSTQARILSQNLASGSRHDVVLTAEPTDRPIGTLVRSVLRHQVTTTSRALALLYAADRSDHLYNGESGILKSLDEGSIVISDRYFYSSLAYQGVTEDLPGLVDANLAALDRLNGDLLELAAEPVSMDQLCVAYYHKKQLLTTHVEKAALYARNIHAMAE